MNFKFNLRRKEASKLISQQNIQIGRKEETQFFSQLAIQKGGEK